MMYFSFLATCRAEGCNLLWLSGSQLSFPFAATPGEEKSTSKTQSTAQIYRCALSEGQKSFFLYHPHVSGDQSASLQPELSWQFLPQQGANGPCTGLLCPRGVSEAGDGPYTSVIDASSLRCLSLFRARVPLGRLITL